MRTAKKISNKPGVLNMSRNLTWLALSDFLEEYISKVELSTSVDGFRATLTLATHLDVEYVVADAKTIEQAVSLVLVKSRAIAGLLRRVGQN